MFTDVVGFTALGQANEELALQLLEEHRNVVRPILAKHRGIEVKTMGDAFLVEFPSALEAVRCAVEVQMTLRDRNSAIPERRRVHLRVGIHVGDVMHSKGDILGDAVNVSSRIEPLAPPGGVCISEQAYDHVRNKMGMEFEKLEGKTLKNVSMPIDVYRMVMPWEAKENEVRLDPHRIAVLPLKNMSPDPNDEYFADGMTEELITSLSSVTELTVIARTSVMQYKGSPKRIADIGRELDAGTLIEGSVRKAANKVRITVQLIDARNEGHLWAQNFDKELDDIFAIQSEVAQKVAESLRVHLVESQRRKLERGSTNNTEAYTLYLKGNFYANKRTVEGLKKSLELYGEAVTLDPTFALGHAGMALAYNVIAANHTDDPAVYFPRARESAMRALSLDDDLAEPHAVLAEFAKGYEHDLDKAESEFKRAIELNPNYPTAHQWYWMLLGSERRFEEADKHLRMALELSPLSLIINTNLIDLLYYKGEYDRGIEQGKKVIDMDPTFPYSYTALQRCFTAKSMFDDALRCVDDYSKTGAPMHKNISYSYVYAHKGEKEKSKGLLEQLEAAYQKEHISPYQIAMVHGALGEKEEALRWLEEAYESFDRWVYSMAIDQEFDLVREDPRYLALLKKTGLAGHLRS